jgi:plastocyanin domain-containing protein
MDKILVTILGFGLIGLIYWFFFGKREEPVEMIREGGDIIVDGGYKPNIIKVKKGQETKLTLVRGDPNSCLEEFILPDFKIKKYLPLNKKVEISFTPTKAGEYAFHCGMNMYHGKVVVT